MGFKKKISFIFYFDPWLGGVFGKVWLPGESGPVIRQRCRLKGNSHLPAPQIHRINKPDLNVLQFTICSLCGGISKLFHSRLFLSLCHVFFADRDDGYCSVLKTYQSLSFFAVPLKARGFITPPPVAQLLLTLVDTLCPTDGKVVLCPACPLMDSHTHCSHSIQLPLKAQDKCCAWWVMEEGPRGPLTPHPSHSHPQMWTPCKAPSGRNGSTVFSER